VTTIFADDGLLDELKSLSAEENRSVADIVREAMEEYVKRKRMVPALLPYQARPLFRVHPSSLTGTLPRRD
jgi:hypothetical protein